MIFPRNFGALQTFPLPQVDWHVYVWEKSLNTQLQWNLEQRVKIPRGWILLIFNQKNAAYHGQYLHLFLGGDLSRLVIVKGTKEEVRWCGIKSDKQQTQEFQPGECCWVSYDTYIT